MRSADRIRGALAGITCGVLAFEAHGLEGGGSNSAAFTLVLAISGAVGAGIGSRAGRGTPMCFGLLALGQLIGHMALSITAGAGDPVPAELDGDECSGWLMLAAHAVATVTSALLISAAERCYRLIAGLVWTLLSAFIPGPVTGDRQIRIAGATRRRVAGVLRGTISRRGPPIRLPIAYAA
ncbi:MAG: hypothetical protein J2P18_22610 [Nocardia sp.]|nr:hypothetical protein [Nocardia sp.]